MDPQDLFQKDFLEKSDVEELRGTKEGRQAIALYILRERIAYGLAKVLDKYDLQLPDKEAQDDMVSIIWRSAAGEKPVWEIMSELGHAQELLAKFGMAADVGAFCSTDDVKGNC